MNDIDVKNIKAIIKYRENNKPKLANGGDLSIKDLEEMSTEGLKYTLKRYNSLLTDQYETQLKKQVDYMFIKYGIGDENMIVFDCTHWKQWERALSTDEEATDIEFESCDSDLIKPINVHNMDNIDPDYWKDIHILTELLDKLKCPYAYKYFKDFDSVNEEWYGCLAITRNYKVIPFVIRDDGYFTDEKSLSTIFYKVSNMGNDFYIYKD